jgi:hypothetical protein
MKNTVAKVFKGLTPEQMVACGGKSMPVDAQGRKLEGHPFGDWVSAQVREYRTQQLESLAAAATALSASVAEAERMVALYTDQLQKNAERQAELRARRKV